MNRKDVAMEIALKDFDLSEYSKGYACGDGPNDIPLTKWIKNNFEDYLVVCPSNVRSNLRVHLEENNLNFKILDEDCLRLG